MFFNYFEVIFLLSTETNNFLSVFPQYNLKTKYILHLKD